MTKIKKLKFLNQLALNVFAIGAVVALLLGLFTEKAYLVVSVGIASVISALLIRHSLKCPFCGYPVLQKKENLLKCAGYYKDIPPKCPNCNKELE